MQDEDGWVKALKRKVMLPSKHLILCISYFYIPCVYFFSFHFRNNASLKLEDVWVILPSSSRQIIKSERGKVCRGKIQ